MTRFDKASKEDIMRKLSDLGYKQKQNSRGRVCWSDCMQAILILFLLIFTPVIVFANADPITWKGTYYHAVPARKGITVNYCKTHTPGTFIHVVNKMLLHPVMTNREIKLDHASFHEDKVGGIYLVYGDLWANGISRNVQWKDHIHYYLYKYSEAGITRGVWYTKDCKGLYRGETIMK